MQRIRATSIGLSALAAGVVVAHATPTLAQDEDDGPVKGDYYAQGDIKPEESLKKSAVESTLAIGATLSINDTQSWIGQTDGSTINFGFKLEAMVDVYEQRHEWRHQLFIGEGLTQTPIVDELVKTRDVATYETLYLYYVNDWFGPFARFGAQTALFRGQDVRPGEVTYQVARVDGTSDQIAPCARSRSTSRSARASAPARRSRPASSR